MLSILGVTLQIDNEYQKCQIFFVPSILLSRTLNQSIKLIITRLIWVKNGLKGKTLVLGSPPQKSYLDEDLTDSCLKFRRYVCSSQLNRVIIKKEWLRPVSRLLCGTSRLLWGTFWALLPNVISFIINIVKTLNFVKFVKSIKIC